MSAKRERSQRAQAPPPIPARGSTRGLLFVCLLIILIKNPTAIYRTLGVLYKFLFAAAAVVVIADYASLRVERSLGRGRNRIRGVAAFGFFLAAAVVVVLVDALLVQDIDVLLTVQFVINVAQFFLVLHLVRRVTTPRQLLHVTYKTAVVLAVPTLVMWAFNFAGWFPFPPFQAWKASDNDQQIIFYPPLGFSGSLLPASATLYRSYSIFSEPAYVPFFFLPFCTFSAFQFRMTRQWRHVVAFSLLSGAAITSSSVAGAVVTVCTSVAVVAYHWIRRPLTVRYLVASVALVAGCVVAMSVWFQAADNRENVYLYQRYSAVMNRLHQFGVALEYTGQHVFGAGIGKVTPVEVYREESNAVETYDKFTNILEVVYYLGLISVVPLMLLLWSVGRHIMRGLAAPDGETRTFAIMMLFMLLYNAADQLLFSGYFLTMLAAYYLHRSAPVGLRQIVPPDRRVPAPASQVRSRVG